MRLNHPIKKLRIGWRALVKIKKPKDFFLDYLGMKRGHIIHQLGKTNIKVRAHTIDKSIFAEVALEGLYFPKWLKLKEDSVVLDIGAHIGIFSALIASKMKEGVVYSIEPSKENYNLLLDQIKLNHSNIKPFNIALSDKEGTMKLFEGTHSARGSLLREEGMKSEVVKTVTLNNFFKKNKITKCDLMKMDIEGGEYDVLYSTPKSTFDKIDKIFIEIHKIKGQNRGELITFLDKMGFQTKFKEQDFVYAVKNEN